MSDPEFKRVNANSIRLKGHYQSVAQQGRLPLEVLSSQKPFNGKNEKDCDLNDEDEEEDFKEINTEEVISDRQSPKHRVNKSRHDWSDLITNYRSASSSLVTSDSVEHRPREVTP